MTTLLVADGRVLRPDLTVDRADVLVDRDAGEILAVGPDLTYVKIRHRDPHQGEEHLILAEDLLDEVKARTEAGETVSLPGLGTFSMDEGTLHFEPTQALQNAVNYRNAHLEPLPVSDTPAQEAPPDDEDVARIDGVERRERLVDPADAPWNA